MRTPAVLAVALLALLAGGLWAMGCTDLSNDCELKVDCMPNQPPPKCANIMFGACGACLEDSCCQELSDCYHDDTANCYYCYNSVWPAADYCMFAATKTLLDPMVACAAANCMLECAPVDSCNPVTSTGCAASDGACRAVAPGVFFCDSYMKDAYANLCDPCGNAWNSGGPFCGPGTYCFEGSSQCARFCCDDKDCGTGKCVKDQAMVFGASLVFPGDAVGLCLKDGAAPAPACDAPETAPSNGTCFTGFQ